MTTYVSPTLKEIRCAKILNEWETGRWKCSKFISSEEMVNTSNQCQDHQKVAPNKLHITNKINLIFLVVCLIVFCFLWEIKVALPLAPKLECVLFLTLPSPLLRWTHTLSPIYSDWDFSYLIWMSLKLWYHNKTLCGPRLLHRTVLHISLRTATTSTVRSSFMY